MKEHTLIPLETLSKITGTAGLASDRVGAMRTEYGANLLTPPEREPLWKQYLEKFDDPIIKILLFAVVISAIVSLVQGGGLLDTIGIIAAILLSTGIAFFNEYRSSREFEVLNAHRDETAIKVIRDGHPVHVASRDIVVGDLILLEAGDAVPADGWVLSSDGLVSDRPGRTACRSSSSHRCV